MRSYNLKLKIFFITILFCGIFGIVESSLAADYYIAETQAGNGDALSCVNAKASTWAWTSPNVIAGDTVYVCGTLSTITSVKIAGTTLKFCKDGEANCGTGNIGKFSADTWATTRGAIECSNKSDVAIDCNGGIIEAVDNGSSVWTIPAGNKKYQNDLYGIYAQSCDNVEIKNCTIQNLYLRSMSSNDPVKAGVGIKTSVGNNVHIHHNTITQSSYGINVGYSGVDNTGAEINDNTIYRTSTGIVDATNSGVATNNVTGETNIHDNEIYDMEFWGGEYKYVSYSTKTGNFTMGEIVRGGTSGASGTVYWDDSRYSSKQLYIENETGTFQNGETITGDDSGAYFVTTSILATSWFHGDGIHIWGGDLTHFFDKIIISGNYMHGDFGTHYSAAVYPQVAVRDLYVYNNLMISTAHNPTDGYIALAMSALSGYAYIFNNTIIGPPAKGGNCVYLAGLNQLDYVYNNICKNVYVGIVDKSGTPFYSNYNSIYNYTAFGGIVDAQHSFDNWKSGARGVRFKNQSAAFTVGQTVTGQTGGGHGIIRCVRSNGSNDGIYKLSISGFTGTEFADGEIITDPLGGSAVVDGNPMKYDYLGSTVEDPQLDSNGLLTTNTQSGAWHVRDGGIDVSSNLGCIVGNTCKDYLGVIRPQGAGWDMGAYEYQSEDTTPPSAPNGLQVS